MGNGEMIFETAGLEEVSFDDIGGLLVSNGQLKGIYYSRMMLPPERDAVLVPVKRFTMPLCALEAMLAKIAAVLDAHQPGASAVLQIIKTISATAH